MVLNYIPRQVISFLSDLDDSLYGAEFVAAAVSNTYFIKNIIYPKYNFFKDAQSIRRYQKAIPRFMQMVSCAYGNVTSGSLDAYLRDHILTGLETSLPTEEIIDANRRVYNYAYGLPFAFLWRDGTFPGK